MDPVYCTFQTKIIIVTVVKHEIILVCTPNKLFFFLQVEEPSRIVLDTDTCQLYQA